MMGLLRRSRRGAASPEVAGLADVTHGLDLDDPGDHPDALLASIRKVEVLVNRNAGRLPINAVVDARHLTDTLREIVDTSTTRALDAFALSSLRGIAEDYLPTTLATYLAVDPGLVEQTHGHGPTPQQALAEQIRDLHGSALASLDAIRRQDVDALLTQGNFLRTKFTRSDLEL